MLETNTKRIILSLVASIAIITMTFFGWIFGLRYYAHSLFNESSVAKSQEIQTNCNYYQRMATIHWTQASELLRQRNAALSINQRQEWSRLSAEYDKEKSIAENWEDQYQNCKNPKTPQTDTQTKTKTQIQ
jgi:hypothetical protein